MALTYGGTDVSGVKDTPTGFSQAPIVFPTTVDYSKTYPISIDKATVDTTATGSTNYTALVAAVDAAVAALIGADFDDTANTVTAAGRVTSFNLVGGTKYLNTTNTGSYDCNVVTSIEVVVI